MSKMWMILIVGGIVAWWLHGMNKMYGLIAGAATLGLAYMNRR